METETLTTCPSCGAEGIFAPDIWGVETFFHKIPSTRLEGYYSFTNVHNSK
jgi:hypothetical protein